MEATDTDVWSQYVILSGGLGQSKYLHQKVKAMPEMSGQISVLQGMDASSYVHLLSSRLDSSF